MYIYLGSLDIGSVKRVVNASQLLEEANNPTLWKEMKAVVQEQNSRVKNDEVPPPAKLVPRNSRGGVGVNPCLRQYFFLAGRRTFLFGRSDGL